MKRDVRLSRQLVLEAQAQVSDGAGGFNESWTTLGTLWADVAGGNGRDVAGVEVTHAMVPLKITVRAAPVGAPDRPRAGQRFVEGTRVYPIEAVSERDGDGRFLVCFAREEVVQ